MEFSAKKLRHDVVANLFKVRIDSIKPYALMLAPVYIYLKSNRKLIAVKGPLDFFTASELRHLIPFKYFYFSPFIAAVLPYREAGRQARFVLNMKEQEVVGKAESLYPEIILPPSPFERSDAILRIIGPLWWKYKEGVGVDPFLVTVFVNELCMLFPTDKLMLARDKDIENYDLALLRSSWVVFLCLLLGYCSLEFINNIRIQVFDDVINKKLVKSDAEEILDIISISYSTLRSSRLKIIKSDVFSESDEKIGLKLAARMKRVEREFLSSGSHPPSIYGKRGFIDV